MSDLRASIGDVPLDFTAIDFETANSSPASACSVGLVKVRSGEVVDRASWFIRPPVGHDAFLEWNTRIHGIVADDVVGAKSWADQYLDIVAFAEGDVLVAHNARFDMGVIAGGCAATGAALAEHHSMCSLAVARKTYTLDSYRLPMAARAAGWGNFSHHDAAADAEACARIVIHAAGRHGADTLEALGAVTRVHIAPVRARTTATGGAAGADAAGAAGARSGAPGAHSGAPGGRAGAGASSGTSRARQPRLSNRPMALSFEYRTD